MFVVEGDKNIFEYIEISTQSGGEGDTKGQVWAIILQQFYAINCECGKNTIICAN